MGPRRVSLTPSRSVKENFGHNFPTIGFAGRARARAGCVARTVAGTRQPRRGGRAFDSFESGSGPGAGEPGAGGVVDAAGERVWRAFAGYAGGGSEHARRTDQSNRGSPWGA